MDPTASQRPIRVLCLDGGGYLGLASAAFLRCAERHFGASCHSQFDLFVGTSTGGLIALSLASGKRADEVEAMYRALGPRVFPARSMFFRFLRWVRQFFWAKYGNAALREVLTETFQNKTLSDIHALGKCVAVPALSAATGAPRIFKTNHSSVLTRDGGVSLVDVALATSAAPTYFPAARVHHAHDGASDVYVDGGVFANNPSLIGLVEALTYMDAAPTRLQILSVATPRPDLRIKKRHFTWGGGIASWARALPDIFINSPSYLVDRALVELTTKLGIVYERISLPQARDPIPLDLATDEATDALTRIGVNSASENDVRRRLRPFFQD